MNWVDLFLSEIRNSRSYLASAQRIVAKDIDDPKFIDKMHEYDHAVDVWGDASKSVEEMVTDFRRGRLLTNLDDYQFENVREKMMSVSEKLYQKLRKFHEYQIKNCKRIGAAA